MDGVFMNWNEFFDADHIPSKSNLKSPTANALHNRDGI
jgi:hypothetical protein